MRSKVAPPGWKLGGAQGVAASGAVRGDTCADWGGLSAAWSGLTLATPFRSIQYVKIVPHGAMQGHISEAQMGPNSVSHHGVH